MPLSRFADDSAGKGISSLLHKETQTKNDPQNINIWEKQSKEVSLPILRFAAVKSVQLTTQRNINEEQALEH